MRLCIDEIDMPQLGRKRTVRVLLPEGYDGETTRRYPVLYMQDGHNLFDPATASYGTHWAIRESLGRMNADGTCPPLIVAGVDCNLAGFKRLDEYSPWTNTQAPRTMTRFFGSGTASVGGEGEAYAAFLADTLKPWIDAGFRTMPDRSAIAGSSMGALISLYACYRRPGLYAGVGAFSTAVWFAKSGLFDFLRGNWIPRRPVYLDIGTAESSDEGIREFPDIYERDTRELAALLSSLGQAPEDLKLVVEVGATHCEASWARRFPSFVAWLATRLGW